MSELRPVRKAEVRMLGSGCLLIFTAWSFLFLFDFSPHGPVGRSWIHALSPFCFLGLLSIAEFAVPWFGITVFILIWPQMYPLRELASTHLSQMLSGFPECWGGPLAAVFGVAIWARREVAWVRHRSEADCRDPAALPPARAFQDSWLAAVKALLSLLVAVWVIALVLGIWNVLHAGPRWHTVPPTWANRNSPWELSAWRPWIKTAEYLPAFLLGLLLLNGLGDSARGPLGFGSERAPARRLLAALGVTGLLCAAQVLVEARWALKWQFAATLEAGPFPNRNATGVFLVITAVAWLALIPLFRCGWRFLLTIPASAVLVAAPLTQSRNGMVIALLLPWLALFLRPAARTVPAPTGAEDVGRATGPGRRVLARFRQLLGRAAHAAWARTLFAGVLAALLLWAAYRYPLDPAQTIAPSGARARIQKTLVAIRDGTLWLGTDGRGALFRAAWAIFAEHWVAGSGVGTFPMLAHPTLPLGAEFTYGTVYFSSHSIPMDCLCEMGPLGCLGWSGLWVFMPWLSLTRWPHGKSFMFLALLAGLANLFDTIFLIPGMAATMVLFLVLAFHARDLGADPGSERTDGLRPAPVEGSH